MNELKFLDSSIQMPLMSLPVRTVYVPLSEGKILISPGSRLSRDHMKSLWHVSDLVAPNLMHGGGIVRAHKIYHKAKVWGAPGSRKVKPKIPWTNELSVKDWPYQEELPMIQIEGIPRMRECVFVHKASGTLIVADLVFNLRRPRGFWSWVILNLFGTYDRFAVSRLFMRWVEGKEAFTQSMREIMKYDFDRIIMSHGSPVEKNGKNLLRAALAERGIIV